MQILHFIYRSKMPIVYLCITFKIKFDNGKTCKYSIIFTLRSVAMLPRAFGPPI